ncbi:MAG: isocitrate/isopropylmalate dehydrogenase family protein, partial [Methanotrichaceae archaeon]|nr:isocitrate/isopropylmalate dehydrogenase family protein [Methanotrichaceae archaeon]
MSERKDAIERAKAHFEKLLIEQMDRVKQMKAAEDWIDYSKVEPIVIGVVGGDGIGPYISAEASRVLRHMLKDEVESGKVEIINVEGLSIEERAKAMKALPDGVIDELKKCHAILKGPLTT